MTGMTEISSAAELRELIGEPSAHAAHKTRDRLHELDRQWLARSPFCLMATSDAQGRCDVSPKGDPAGFTHVLDDTTLVIPDRPGNKRLDGMLNILSNPHIGLNYLLPGRGDTLRINGRARLLRDAPFFDELIVKGNRPRLALLVEVEEVFYHCSKAFLRSSCGIRRPGSRTHCPRGPGSSRAWRPRRCRWRSWSSTTARGMRRSSTAEAPRRALRRAARGPGARRPGAGAAAGVAELRRGRTLRTRSVP